VAGIPEIGRKGARVRFARAISFEPSADPRNTMRTKKSAESFASGRPTDPRASGKSLLWVKLRPARPIGPRPLYPPPISGSPWRHTSRPVSVSTFQSQISRIFQNPDPIGPPLNFGFPRFTIERVSNALIDLGAVQCPLRMIERRKYVILHGSPCARSASCGRCHVDKHR
jgi:hypothetical protein